MPLAIAKTLSPEGFGSYSLSMMIVFFFTSAFIASSQTPFVVCANEEFKKTKKINKSFSVQLLFLFTSIVFFIILTFIFSDYITNFAKISKDNLKFLEETQQIKMQNKRIDRSFIGVLPKNTDEIGKNAMDVLCYIPDILRTINESVEAMLIDIKLKLGFPIVKIEKEILNDNDIIDASGFLVFPGGIDPHVHFNDPGYTFNEDFYHGSCAAGSGGITTIVDMPCTSVPPVTNKQNLEKKLSVVQKKSVTDFGFFGGISAQSFKEGFPENVYELSKYVLGFKTYFISGMEKFGRLDKFQFR